MRKKCLSVLGAFLVLLVLGAIPSPRAQSVSGAPEGMLIWIELDRKRLTVYENGIETAVFPIASGARDTPSPVGVFRINSRFSTALSGFGTRFLGLNVPWGQYGIHGTNQPSSIGRNASHGCIRLTVRDGERLYAMVPLGAQVVLDGGAYGALYMGMRSLKEGDRGADVYQLQRRLILHGFLKGNADGIFGPSTRQAVVEARKKFRLTVSDQADYALQRALGIMQFE